MAKVPQDFLDDPAVVDDGDDAPVCVRRIGRHEVLADWAAERIGMPDLEKQAEAIAAAEKARDIALAAGEKEAAAKASGLLELYRSKQPFRVAF
jgi:hypothetical protein